MNLKLDEYKFTISRDKYIYIYEIKNNEIKIKRISEIDNTKKVEFIEIYNDKTEIYSKIFKDKKTIKQYLNKKETDELEKDVLNIMSNSIFKNFIDIKMLSNKIKNNYINYIISDGLIALSKNNYKNNLLNIILIEDNEIIGSVSLDDLNIIVDEYYIESTLNLLKKYVCLFKDEKTLKLIK